MTFAARAPDDRGARGRATAVGFLAVLLWSLLASLTALTTALPPFQLLAMSFAVGGLAGLAVLAATGGAGRAARGVPIAAWTLMVAGLFGYHLFYFLALRLAPAVEANLVNYLWPLLIVLLSALPTAAGERPALRWWHVAGALAGFAGTVLVVTEGRGAAAAEGAWAGYACALAAAVVWSSYSVLSRRFAHVPSGAVAFACLATAALALVCHLGLEATVAPRDGLEWAAVAAMGLGPLGLAFYVWDHGCKRGDIRVLGATAYAAPPLSTLLLVLLGLGVAGPSLWLACLLVTGGAALAARDLLRRRPRA